MFQRVISKFPFLQWRLTHFVSPNHIASRNNVRFLSVLVSSNHSHENLFVSNFHRNNNNEFNRRRFYTAMGDCGESSSSPTSSTPTTDWTKLTNEEWAERLTPDAYFCAREGGTEPPFSGQYVNHKGEGVYKCVGCGSELFLSKTKYDSGSGWPSFYAPVEDNRIIRRKDVSHGMVRNEVLCASCNAHLGHVFDDGPEPTGERFCMNSICLKFAPKKMS